DPEIARHEHGVELKTMDDAKEADCIIVAVAHDEFRNMSLEDIGSYFKAGEQDTKVLVDVKGLYSINDLKETGLRYWRL
ncbi:MAG: hypothetical protein LC101_03370, partial [Flavobacteriales bacterium]|nr:hypothetical protein [Flavobacteriales bacterium]